MGGAGVSEGRRVGLPLHPVDKSTYQPNQHIGAPLAINSVPGGMPGGFFNERMVNIMKPNQRIPSIPLGRALLCIACNTIHGGQSCPCGSGPSYPMKPWVDNTGDGILKKREEENHGNMGTSRRMYPLRKYGMVE